MRTLIVFAKLPLEGQVKTRLTASTSLFPEQTVRLYEAFLQDTLTVATQTSADKIALHYWPGDERGDKGMRRLVRKLNLGARNERRFAYVPQSGESFTDRVKRAFAAETGDGDDALLMIGADAPVITPETLDAAFDFVDIRSGAALGPTGEGGAWLIGFPSQTPLNLDTAFTHGAELLNLTAEARRLSLPMKLLPQALDIDVEADLVTLVALLGALEYQRAFETQALPMHTLRVVEELGLTVERTGDESRDKKIVVPQPA